MAGGLFGLGAGTPSRFPYPGRPQPSPAVGPSSATVVRANRVIVTGPNGGIYVYSGPPASGNLIESIGIVSGTNFDPFHLNAVLPGDTRYHNNGAGVFVAQQSTQSLVADLWQATSPLGPYTEMKTNISFTNEFTSQPILELAGRMILLNGDPPGGTLGWMIIPPSGDTTGATDQANIQTQLAQGHHVQLLPGDYWINALLTVRSNNVLRGCGHQVTRVNIANAANCQAIQTFNFATLTGSGSNTGGAGEFQISGITFDGNRANQSVPAAAAMQIYGYDFTLFDVDIVHFLSTDGLWTEFGAGGLPGPEGADEARYLHMRIMNNTFTGAGWRDRGPHDSHGYSIFIAFNSAGGPPWPVTGYLAQQSAGVYTTGNSLRTQMHVYGNHGIAYDLQDSVRFVNSIAEGSSGTQLLIEAGDCSWTGGNIFPGGAAGGNGIQIGTLANEGTGFTVVGTELQNFAGTSAATAAVNLVNSGTGKLDVTCFQPTGQAVWGTNAGPQVDTRISYLQTNVPAAAALAGLGAGPPAPTVSHASDLRGTIIIGTGAAPAAGDAVTITFQQPMVQAVPNVAIWAANAATAALNPYVRTVTQAGFTVGFSGVPAAGQAAGTYQVAWAVTG